MAKPLKTVIDYIRESQALWLFNGDGADNGTKNSPGSAMAEQLIDPNEQIDQLSDMLYPIRHLCIGLNKGNHEDRTKKEANYDIAKQLARNLGVHYFIHEMYFVISNRDKKNGGTAYTFYANHSASGHKNSGSGANYMQNNWMPWLENVDIMCKGHDHNVGLFPVGSTYFDTSNLVARDRVRWLWMPGSFLAKGKGYAAKKPYSPQPRLYYSLRLDMRKGRKKVEGVQHEL